MVRRFVRYQLGETVDRRMAYKRILLKLSGEALMGKEGYGIDPETMRDIAGQVKGVKETGVDIAIVIGGGNIYRGMRAEKQGIDRVTGDYMGMIATLMNALALQDSLEKLGVQRACKRPCTRLQ